MNYTKTNSCAVILCSQVQTRFSGVISVAPRVCPTLPSETAQGLKSLAAHSFIEKNRQFFTYETCFTHCTVLQQHNEDAMMSLPKAPPKSTKKHKMGNMYSGTFSNKRTSKSLFKKSKVQLKKPCCPLTTATITTSFIQPIFLPWNHFLKNEIYSLTDIAITIRYTTHISANGLLIEWFFR